MFGPSIIFTPRRFVFQGDSHVSGFDPLFSWPIVLNGYPILQPSPFHNFAMGGWTAASVAGQYDSTIHPFAPKITQVPANYWLQVGSNDLSVGTTGAAIYAIIAPVLAKAKADGFFVGCTQLWDDPDFSYTAQLNAYNALLATDPSITSGLLMNGDAVFNSPNNPPYFVDSGNNHLNHTGETFYAANVFGLLQSSGNFI